MMSRRTFRFPIRSWYLLALLVLICALGVACWKASSTPIEEASGAGDFVIGVSPFLSEAEAPVVRSALFRMILEKVPSGSRVTIFDAYRLQRITDFRIPPGKAYESLKIRSKYLGRNLRDVQSFLEAVSAAGAEDKGDGRLQVPQLLDLVAGSRPDNLLPLTVVLLGGALYLDPHDGRFSMESGLYPNDDHLCVTREESVFGVADRRGRLQGARVHYAYLGNPWISGLHEEPVRRFWSLFLAEQGAELVSFARDLPTVVDRMAEPYMHSPASDELQCPAQPKPGMIAVQRPVDINWLEGKTTSCPESGPLQTRGLLKIGIRWRCLDCDLDLYSRPAAGAAELFYGNPRTAEGVYFKDFLTSPTPVNAFEWIEYLEPVDLAEVEAAVNFYGGLSPGGVSGEVRIQTKEGTCGGEFQIKAAEGNRGAESDDRADSRYWTVLDIGALVGLGKGHLPSAGEDKESAPQPPPEGPSTPPQEPSPAAVIAGPARGVRILAPQDGSTIRAQGGESPLPHPVDGDVYGFNQDEIGRFRLTVEVSIFTDKWYPQGIAEVRDNGTWRLPAWFGGSRHIVRAVLTDGNGNEIHSHEVRVTVVH